MKKLPNLNALRFFAAASIVIAHVDVVIVNNGYKKNLYTFAPFSDFSLQAVVMFFVLSGFLITYLLLNEKEQTGISIKKFYISRILRIWPLYFLILLLTFGYFNNSPYFFSKGVSEITGFEKHKAIYSILLLFIAPNVVGMFVPSFGYATISWSIGVEEQFYIFWPHIIKKRNYLIYIVAIILVMYLLTHGILDALVATFRSYLSPFVYFKVKLLSALFTSWRSFKIDAMAIGALGAHLAYTKSSFMKVVFSKPVQIIAYCLLSILFIIPQGAEYQFYSIIFIIIILNLALNPATVITFKSKVLDYFGRISYGIYMYHWLTIIPVVRFVYNYLNMPVNFLTVLLISAISLTITVIISSLSYRFFEKYFLNLKPEQVS